MASVDRFGWNRSFQHHLFHSCRSGFFWGMSSPEEHCCLEQLLGSEQPFAAHIVAQQRMSNSYRNAAPNQLLYQVLQQHLEDR
ncbi:Os05g0143550 [Oryza sativa Japonica Group]|uniref:Os05g0143550 protein n=2 Tax=Oryza sativa subsp. japonica TaxID=39947 RepID=C7J2T5_ORYSJ|nr:hypothetical protein EE612_027039 [Oryza sativa]BAH92942.1 Os05g0143550 [Oryza sativa Japonica Group]BAS92222.1 Os05g0143550 [Oryza sativa Japonica Group]|eukprot:NP_001174214.1 Os05g0143550 [Oryza sativa Japonica Group]